MSLRPNRRTRYAAYLVACLPLVAAAGAVEAQAPGYPPIDPAVIRAEYAAEVLERINELLADWGDSWSNDRPDDLADLYWEDALLLVPDGTQIRGHEGILEYFNRALPEQGQVEAFMLDFDASGGMSQVFGNYSMSIQRGDEAGTVKRGPLMTIYLRRGRSWKIRTQVFFPS